mgnify:CR=1 FL=1|jgi:hypothetical protein
MMAMIDTSMIGIKHSDDSTSSLDSLFGYDAGDVETTSTIEVVGSGNLPLAIQEFENFFIDRSMSSREIKTSLVLTPSEIDAFLKLSERYTNSFNNRFNVGIFTSRLISNSYHEGKNNCFFLNVNRTSFCLASHLQCNDNDHIKITVNGDIGFGFASFSSNLDIIINGDVGGYFGQDSINLCSKIDGNCSFYFGCQSKYLTAIITKDVETNFADNSKSLSAIIKGDAKSDFGTEAIKLIAYVNGKIDNLKLNSASCYVRSGSVGFGYNEIIQKVNKRLGE